MHLFAFRAIFFVISIYLLVYCPVFGEDRHLGPSHIPPKRDSSLNSGNFLKGGKTCRYTAPRVAQKNCQLDHSQHNNGSVCHVILPFFLSEFFFKCRQNGLRKNQPSLTPIPNPMFCPQKNQPDIFGIAPGPTNNNSCGLEVIRRLFGLCGCMAYDPWKMAYLPTFTINNSSTISTCW